MTKVPIVSPDNFGFEDKSLDIQNPLYLEKEYYFMELEIKIIETDFNFS